MDRWFERSGLFMKLLASGLGTILAISLLWIGSSTYFLDQVNQAARVRALANHVSIELYQCRVSEKNIQIRDLVKDKFYSTGESEELAKYREAMGRLKDTVAELEIELGRDNPTVRKIKEAVLSCESVFTTLVGAYRQRGFGTWGLTGQWAKASDELEREVLRTGDGQMIALLAELLRSERLYGMTDAPEHAAPLRDLTARLRSRVAGLKGAGPVDLVGRLDRYADALARYMAILEEIGGAGQGLLGKYRDQANSIDPLAQELLEQAVAASNQSMARMSLANVAIALLGLVLGGIIFYALSRGITRPLRTVAEVAERVAAGEVALEAELKGERQDEIGTLLQSFRSMVASLRERAGVAQRIAAGDLGADLGAVQDRDALGMALRTMLANLRSQVREIKDGAAVLGSSTAEISAAVSQVTASAAETATAVTETMATAEELRQTSELSAQKAGHVSKSANESAARSAEGQQAITQIIQAMEHIRRQMEAIGASVISLSEQSQVIGEIIGTVDDLAEQSNILSVNASIEAAKAGEHGRGFAVVAQEIKSLAEKSKEGTARVRTILADIQKATASAVMVTEQGSKAVAKGVEQADEASRSIAALAESIGAVDHAAMQIMASSKQQLSGMEQVAAAIENIREATEQNVKSMEQLEATASALADIGRKIVDLVGWYKV
ncbi:MAG: methyl-accepting chemotaxis protein [Thermodesulfobacteriota bacterium]